MDYNKIKKVLLIRLLIDLRILKRKPLAILFLLFFIVIYILISAPLQEVVKLQKVGIVDSFQRLGNDNTERIKNLKFGQSLFNSLNENSKKSFEFICFNSLEAAQKSLASLEIAYVINIDSNEKLPNFSVIEADYNEHLRDVLVITTYAYFIRNLAELTELPTFHPIKKYLLKQEVLHEIPNHSSEEVSSFKNPLMPVILLMIYLATGRAFLPASKEASRVFDYNAAHLSFKEIVVIESFGVLLIASIFATFAVLPAFIEQPSSLYNWILILISCSFSFLFQVLLMLTLESMAGLFNQNWFINLFFSLARFFIFIFIAAFPVMVVAGAHLDEYRRFCMLIPSFSFIAHVVAFLNNKLEPIYILTSIPVSIVGLLILFPICSAFFKAAVLMRNQTFTFERLRRSLVR